MNTRHWVTRKAVKILDAVPRKAWRWVQLECGHVKLMPARTAGHRINTHLTCLDCSLRAEHESTTTKASADNTAICL